MKQSGIYKILCLSNGRIYIGSSVDLNKRIRCHFQRLRLGSHTNRHLQSAFSKYGESAFTSEIVEVVTAKERLIEREQYWLDLTQCYDRTIGFNMCAIADSSLGVKRSEEFKEKVRSINLNRSSEVKERVKRAVIAANTGRVSWNKGIKMPLEMRRKTSSKGMKFPNRRPISHEDYLKVCEANRKPRGEAYLQNRSLISSKTYFFVSPEGAQIKIENMRVFCGKMGLNHSHMYQVARRNIVHHRGWRLDGECVQG